MGVGGGETYLYHCRQSAFIKVTTQRLQHRRLLEGFARIRLHVPASQVHLYCPIYDCAVWMLRLVCAFIFAYNKSALIYCTVLIIVQTTSMRRMQLKWFWLV